MIKGSRINAIMNSYKFVKESGGNDTKWYRLWTDGWIEQGGRLTATAFSNTVTLHKEFKNTNYTVLSQFTWTTAGDVKYPPREIIASRTTKTFVLTTAYAYASGMGMQWYACGF